MRGGGLLMLAVMAGCSSTTGPDRRANMDEPFVLKVGERAYLEESGLFVRFARVVSDSRCPSDALILCVWEGEAAIAVETTGLPGGVRTDTLHTRLEPQAVDFGEVVLELEGVDPYPRTTTPIPTEDYVAAFVARRSD